jgi:four helix bundle protein
MDFPKDLRLCGQIQAAAASIMANIAEGFIRRSDKEFIQFLFIAMSSAAEVQSHLYVAFDQRYLDKKTFDSIYEQVNKNSYDHLRSDQIPPHQINETDQMTRQTK